MSTDADPPIRRSLNGPAMGSRWTAVFHGPEAMPTDRIAADLAATAERVEQQMSTWRPGSDLMRLNAAPLGTWVALPPELLEVLAAALRINRDSGGLFDAGVGSLVAAWGFGPAQGQVDAPRLRAHLASPAERSCATDATLELDRDSGRARKHAHLDLELSGIAKGYGVDALTRVCDDHGLNSFLVGIDGEMRARGRKPDHHPWAVALELPVADRREAMGVIELADRAVATSGDYRHVVQVGQTRFSHSMSPQRGGPVQNRLGSVSVLAETCMEADAWATVLMVLGEDAGPAFARERGLDAIFVIRDADAFRVVKSFT
jgi:FAD:protein FMN transferase